MNFGWLTATSYNARVAIAIRRSSREINGMSYAAILDLLPAPSPMLRRFAALLEPNDDALSRPWRRKRAR